ncbi:MAG: AIR synthase related protein, partial [Acidobacteriota bacterium]
MPKEFEFINKIRQQYSLDKIGDDCAVLPKNKTHDMLITSDLIVEDIDFRRSWMIPEFLGHKALAVSISDIAAMGGKPLYSMLSIGIPEDVWTTDFVDEFYEGYFKLARPFGVELIGGDVSKTPDKIVIDSTVIGEVERNKAVMRTGAKVGDLIFVTGELGGASAG